MDYSFLVGIHKLGQNDVLRLIHERKDTHTFEGGILARSGAQWLSLSCVFLSLSLSLSKRCRCAIRDEEGELHQSRELYFFRIIDILQLWTLRKVIESKMKSLLFQQVPTSSSSSSSPPSFTSPPSLPLLFGVLLATHQNICVHSSLIVTQHSQCTRTGPTVFHRASGLFAALSAVLIQQICVSLFSLSLSLCTLLLFVVVPLVNMSFHKIVVSQLNSLRILYTLA